jgi:hypothetical protein
MLANRNGRCARWHHGITRFSVSALLVLIVGALGVNAAYANPDQLSPTALQLDEVGISGFVYCPYPLISKLRSTATVSLGAPAAANDTVTLGASGPLSLSTRSVVIRQGASSATFTVTALQTRYSGPASVTASLNGSSSTFPTTVDYCHN